MNSSRGLKADSSTIVYSYETVVYRWPIIITKLIDHIHRVNHEIIMRANNSETKDVAWEERVEEGKDIIGKVSKLKYEMSRDKVLLYALNFLGAVSGS